MSNELATTDGSPFNRALAVGTGGNVGAIAIESERAIAEAQGQLTLAKRFPRSQTAATTEFLDTCKSPEFAATAFYSVPNRGSGPSIRFAEEAARCYGNFVYGHRELSRSDGKSEIEVFAWDMERNNRSTRQITVAHVTDTRSGPKKLTDQTDIDNKIANVASKQMRGRILALMPKGMIAAGQAECKRTLAGGSEKPLSERLIAMAGAFGRFGVSNTHLIAYLGHSVDTTTIDELSDLMGIFNALREGAKASEYFKLDDAADGKTDAAPAAIQAQVEQNRTPAATTSRTRAATTTKSKTTESDSKQTKETPAESSDKQPQQQAASEPQQQAEAEQTKPATTAEEQPQTQNTNTAPASDDNDDPF